MRMEVLEHGEAFADEYDAKLDTPDFWFGPTLCGEGGLGVILMPGRLSHRVISVVS
jgi:hypothetical protein